MNLHLTDLATVLTRAQWTNKKKMEERFELLPPSKCAYFTPNIEYYKIIIINERTQTVRLANIMNKLNKIIGKNHFKIERNASYCDCAHRNFIESSGMQITNQASK